MSDIDDDCYANLLYHAADEQLLRRQELEQFIAKYSRTIPMLVFHTLASSTLPEMIHLRKLKEILQCFTTSFSSLFDGMEGGALPYHDNILFLQVLGNAAVKLEGISHKNKSRSDVLSEPWAGFSHEAEQFLKQIIGIYPDVSCVEELSSGFHFFDRFIRLVKLVFPKLDSFLSSLFLNMARGGCRLDKLSHLSATFHANTVLPPENGYTRIFEKGESVTLDQLRVELMTTNTRAQRNENEDWMERRAHTNTIAISYKHFADGSQQKLSDRDLHAIHRFLVASEGSNVRFWIDLKLPHTNDGSFERWLTRGVRPYGRYCTLVCPSAYEEKERYWIQMERVIALAARGIFFTTEEGVYFKKTMYSYRQLCHRMLTMMIGIHGIPTGLRRQDEGKVIQWALGFLGDQDSVRLFRLRGPRLDGLANEEFSENVVMQNITLLIREHGPLALPVETGKSWNEDNPLILKGFSDQILLLPTWIGFWNPRNPRKILFLNGTSLPQVIYGGFVGLEVTLRERFVKGEKNEVVRKELRDIPYSELVHTTLLPDTTNEKHEAMSSTNDKLETMTLSDFKCLSLEALAKEGRLAPELRSVIRLSHCLDALSRTDSANGEMEDEFPLAPSQDTDSDDVPLDESVTEGGLSNKTNVIENLFQCVVELVQREHERLSRASAELAIESEEDALCETESMVNESEEDSSSATAREEEAKNAWITLEPKMRGLEAVVFPWECDWI